MELVEYITLALFTVFMSILQGLGQEIARDLKKAILKHVHGEEEHAQKT